MAVALAALFVPAIQAGDQAAPRKTPETFDQLAKQAASAQHQGDAKLAVSFYLQALEIRPNWALGWRNVGMLLADLHDYPRAAEALRNLVGADPKSGEGWALLGLTEYELGRYDDAYRDIELGRTLGVGNADLEHVAAFHSALILIQKSEFERAGRTLLRVAEAGVNDPDLVAAFGLVALRLPEKPEQVEPAQRNLVEQVGQIEFQAVNAASSRSIEAYQKLLAEMPRTPRLHYAYGNFLITAGHFDEGIAEMRKEIEVSPQDPMPPLQIALADLRIGQAPAALPYAEKAVRLAPKLFAAHYALGWALYHLGENDKAIPELEEVVKLAPDSFQGHYALSVAYAKAGRKGDAARERASYAKLKQAEPAPSGTPAARGNAGSAPSSRQ
ncbi:MAG TPA: tetratricopeptide repeat protein [Terriglobia bacterium]|nr:tetratricopeptide repeat protein [Terriglobia bacterium]